MCSEINLLKDVNLWIKNKEHLQQRSKPIKLLAL